MGNTPPLANNRDTYRVQFLDATNADIDVGVFLSVRVVGWLNVQLTYERFIAKIFVYLETWQVLIQIFSSVRLKNTLCLIRRILLPAHLQNSFLFASSYITSPISKTLVHFP